MFGKSLIVAITIRIITPTAMPPYFSIRQLKLAYNYIALYLE